MYYKSTRNNSISVASSQAILKGISEEGGLFVPDSMPWFSYDDIKDLTEKSYVQRAVAVLGRFLSDFTEEELEDCLGRAYTREKFETDSIAPIYMLENNLYLLELWHGPTCAFKDMALQVLPHLLTMAKAKQGVDKTALVLVATSGDTGKAALEGFKDVDGTKIIVFYPEDGVSNMQKLQMTTQDGGNVRVCAVKGNFDDAQNGVKAIFTDKSVQESISRRGMFFSSANSINWGRLAPQIAYYVSAYCDLIKNSRIVCGERINVVVPTGNFGNILAAYYAKKTGIPINKLICASNANNVLTDFIKTGVYDRNRPFYTSISPSMDILISSNLERLLFDFTGCDDEKIRGWMSELAKNGRYETDDAVKSKLMEHFSAGFCGDEETRATIKEIYQKYNYICDPHTAVALNVYEQYRKTADDGTKTIIASTASPFKFSGNVLEAVKGKASSQDEFVKISELSELSMLNAPKQLLLIHEKAQRFTESCEKDMMKNYVLKCVEEQ